MREDRLEHKARFDLKVWKGLWRFVSHYRWHLLGLVFVMTLVGLLEATFPYLTKYAIDNFIVRKSLEGFWKFVVLYFGLVVLQALNTYLLVYLAWRIENGFTYELRNGLFSKLVDMPPAFFDRNQTGALISRVMSDVQRISTIMSWQVVDFVWAFSTMVFIVFYMLKLNWRLALFVILAIPPLALVSNFFHVRILKRFRLVRKLVADITGLFNEHLMGAKTVKTLAIEGRLESEFGTKAEELKRTAVAAAALSALYTPVVVFIGNLVTALILVAGGIGVSKGTVTLGTVIAAISYSIQFFEPVQQLARILAEVISAQASAERIVELLNAPVEISDDANGLELEIEGNVEFDNVTFGYVEGQEVLKNFNLKVRKGERLAIVGETGAGKTTIVSLLARFYEPTAGRILIDGVDYRRIKLSALRRQIGFVLQTPHLFNDTVAENIRYGKPDAKMEEIITAAKFVNAHDFILKLENGYETVVGEGGSKLSTGQRQLIALARIVLLNPKILVLDEATSSVDPYTEHLIQDAIYKLLHGRTSFVIAHRLSTIRNADRIIVIEHGKIVEEGNHEQLMKLRGKYYTLYMKQFVYEKESEILGEYKT
ncbi:ABC transporter ATP-binding protein [Fervidobacterium thailandense]|uniref:ABC transporter ATP-binding protein n=1 Tax=Fervidobacterium thailandense TaxID=1008305 RepID=A0A1E3G2M6_9BACT|nr:ABC transporter ATP-binding protein [Fervidobacterium thailandense]ODN30113.1 ABC transporter ATP-binding protein [Fervidobacterium thailandense]